jgi:predicted DNA-binding transcriptional regulator AlpA
MQGEAFMPTNESESKDAVTEQLISAEKLAEMLDVSKRTLQRLRSAGAVPQAVHLGRSVKWRLQDVNQWISRGCLVPTIAETARSSS